MLQGECIVLKLLGRFPSLIEAYTKCLYIINSTYEKTVCEYIKILDSFNKENVDIKVLFGTLHLLHLKMSEKIL